MLTSGSSATNQFQSSQLIGADGQPSYGRFDSPIADINFNDFDLRTVFDKPVSASARRKAFNQFQFIAIHTPELMIGLAIVRLRWVSHAFLYCYNPITQDWKDYRFLQPLQRGLRFGQRPNQDTVSFTRGKNRIVIRATPRPGLRQIKVSLNDGTRIKATIDESTHYQPMSLCTRSGFTGWTYTQKACARVCHGKVHWQGQDYDLEALNALASVDWSGGFMRRETSWNWSNLSGQLIDGRRIGLNLAAGVNETGFSENTLWLDDRRIELPPVHFQFDRHSPNHSWAITSADQSVRLHFDPITAYRDKVNALVVASNFSQYLGHYHGEINIGEEKLELDGQWGLAEDHYARW